MKTIRTGSASAPKLAFNKLLVKDAMRKRVITLPPEATIATVISHFIKYKVNAILIVDEQNLPIGVVSKTEVIGAYYATIPISSPAQDIMGTPALTCFPDDTLDCGITTMQERGIHRLYVVDKQTSQAVGVLAYPDIVGLLYRFCRKCDFSRRTTKKREIQDGNIARIKVGEIMNSDLQNSNLDDTLFEVIEKLSMHKLGALLITNNNNVPRGVISKTDLALAYKHGNKVTTKARQIMSSPVNSCSETEILENGIHRMIFAEINRLFVFRESPKDIVGLFSLSDAAKARSGSCQACSGSRLFM